MTQLSIIIPTLNEQESIGHLLADLSHVISTPFWHNITTEIIVVDDSSDDQTVIAAKHWQDRLPVRIIERTTTRDLSASILDGVSQARGQWVIVMDADGSHPAESLPKLLRPLMDDSHDVVIGSRHVAGAKTSNWPWHRHLTSWLATLLAWPFTQVKDPMAGFFATTKERFDALPRSAAGYKILLEMLVQGGDDIRIKEVPIHFVDRKLGHSKLNIHHQLTYLRRLMNLGGGRISTQTASRFFGVGFIGMLVDLSLFGFLIYLYDNLALAHMAAFGAATLTNFTLNFRWSFKGLDHTSEGPIKRYLRFLVIALLALLMRGGILIFLIETLAWSPWLAIFPAIMATAGINYLGSAFYVFQLTESGASQRVRWHLAAIALFAYVFVLRWLYLGHLDLIPDEMYYWVYTQHLALSYLDHPPLTSWLIAIGTQAFGDTVFGVRALLIPIVIMGAVYFYKYGHTMGGRTIGLLTMLALVALPFFFLSGLVMTPDAPMIVAWAAALYYLKRLLVDGQGRAWLGLGIAMGLGLLAKYSIALLALGGLIFMLMDDKARGQLFKPWLYASIVMATVIFSPVLVWNAQNDYASFGFQFTRRLAENPDFSSHLIVIYALLLLSPIFALTAFYLMVRPFKRHIRKRHTRLNETARANQFMWVMTLTPLSVFALYGVFSVTKFHWTLPAWIALIPLVMRFLFQGLQTQNRPSSLIAKGLVRLWAPSLLVLIIGYGTLLHYLTLGLPGLRKTDFDAAYLGWPELTQRVEGLADEMREATGRWPLVVSTDKWGMSAALAFHSNQLPLERISAQNIIGMQGSMWGFWFDETQEPAQPILLVHHKPELITESWIEDALIEVSPVSREEIWADGANVRTLYYRTAEGFRPEQLRTPTQSPPLPE